MAKKRSIHEIIEEQEPEAKQRMWEEIRHRLDDVDLTGTEKPTKKFPWKKFGTIAASFILVLGISIFSVLYFLPHESSEFKSRYCSQEQYSVQQREESIKQHSDLNLKNWLFFDWYDSAEFLEDYCYFLNDTGEEICYNEQIINGETGDFIKLYITDLRTDLDVLQLIKESCVNVEIVKNITIKWGYNIIYSYAIFEFQKSRYYLELSQPMTETAILDIVEELLP